MNICALNFIDKCLTSLHLQLEPFNYERRKLSYTPNIWCSKIIKLNIINILHKSCRIQKGTFDSNIDLTLSERAKIILRSILFLENPTGVRKLVKNDLVLYFSFHILVVHLESFPKHYNKIFFIKYFSSY